jgi:hypothetical protein
MVSKFWIRVSLAMWNRDVSKLRRFDAHPFGVTVTPPLPPAGLRSASIGPDLSDFELHYGTPLDAGAPVIEVQTCFDEDDCYVPSLEEAITRAEKRDAALARHELTVHIDVFAGEPEIPVPAHAFGCAERAVIVDGAQRSTPVISHDNYEALSFRQGPLLVTAVARFGFPGVPAFQATDDLEPFFAASTMRFGPQAPTA